LRDRPAACYRPRMAVFRAISIAMTTMTITTTLREGRSRSTLP
jgi:hypothetical protein